MQRHLKKTSKVYFSRICLCYNLNIMSGKNLAYVSRKLKKVKTWHIVVVFVVLLLSSLVLLRVNNLNMIKYRDEVIAADESLDEAKVRDAADSLRLYVAAHMNTDTGHIPLQNLYNQAVSEAFSKENEVNSDAYAEATESCKAVLSQRGYSGYSACVADSVGVNEDNFIQPELPNPALYYLSFVSPLWSFDPAGVAVLVTVVVFFAIIFKFLTEVVLSLVIYNRKKL